MLLVDVVFLCRTLDSSSEAEEEEGAGVTGEDLKMLFAYIDEKDGGPPWQLMMDRATSTLTFRAWRRDPKVMDCPCTFVVIVIFS